MGLSLRAQAADERRQVQRTEAVMIQPALSPSKKARRSGMPYFSIAMRSIPMPKAKPW
jgi:hypothetical protein